eukprot:510274-Prymnesium_polylepis.2
MCRYGSVRSRAAAWRAPRRAWAARAAGKAAHGAVAKRARGRRQRSPQAHQPPRAAKAPPAPASAGGGRRMAGGGSALERQRAREANLGVAAAVAIAKQRRALAHDRRVRGRHHKRHVPCANALVIPDDLAAVVILVRPAAGPRWIERIRPARRRLLGARDGILVASEEIEHRRQRATRRATLALALREFVSAHRQARPKRTLVHGSGRMTRAATASRPAQANNRQSLVYEGRARKVGDNRRVLDQGLQASGVRHIAQDRVDTECAAHFVEFGLAASNGGPLQPGRSARAEILAGESSSEAGRAEHLPRQDRTKGSVARTHHMLPYGLLFDLAWCTRRSYERVRIGDLVATAEEEVCERLV